MSLEDCLGAYGFTVTGGDFGWVVLVKLPSSDRQIPRVHRYCLFPRGNSVSHCFAMHEINLRPPTNHFLTPVHATARAPNRLQRKSPASSITRTHPS